MTTNQGKKSHFEQQKIEIRFKINFLQQFKNLITNGNNLFQVLKSLKNTY